MHFHEVRAVDFSNIGFDDEHMDQLCNYLEKNPALYSVTLDRNVFTDAGVKKLAKVLKNNTVLAHLSIKGCKNVTDEGLRDLLEVITYHNMILFEIHLDGAQFDESLSKELVGSASLNRAVQQNLKPKLIINAVHEKLGLLCGSIRHAQPFESSNDKEAFLTTQKTQETGNQEKKLSALSKM